MAGAHWLFVQIRNHVLRGLLNWELGWDLGYGLGNGRVRL
jgi:hypothetical protein